MVDDLRKPSGLGAETPDAKPKPVITRHVKGIRFNHPTRPGITVVYWEGQHNRLGNTLADPRPVPERFRRG